jgi:hypothetical protein
MNDVSAYIKHLREAFHASDDIIIEKLQAAGWSEKDATSAVTLAALPDAPAPTTITHSHHAPKHEAASNKSGLSSLSQAMQHILLWFFSISTTITLSILAASMFYAESSSSEVLSVFVAVSLLTFTPFAFVFWDYLKKYKKDKTTVTGKVWSIITIVVHSLAAIISGVVLLVNLLTNPETGLIVATSVIILMNLLIVTTYYFATFGKPASKFRDICVQVFLPVLFMILALFALYGYTKLAPVKADEQTREKLVKTVEAIRDYRSQNNAKLPTALSSLKDVDTSGITYKKKSETQYSVCATFKLKRRYSYYQTYTRSDNSVSTYDFEVNKTGETCFAFKTTTDNLYTPNESLEQ